MDTFEGEVVAGVFRRDDNEIKLVVVPEGDEMTISEIEDAVSFQEKYFDSFVDWDVFVPEELEGEIEDKQEYSK